VDQGKVILVSDISCLFSTGTMYVLFEFFPLSKSMRQVILWPPYHGTRPAPMTTTVVVIR